MQDDNAELSLLVDRSVGGSSLVDGQIELMLHRFVRPFITFCYNYCSMSVAEPRLLVFMISDYLFFFSNKKRRLLHDDVRGVGEVLNETVCVQNECEGLTVSMPFQLIFSVAVKQGLS